MSTRRRLTIAAPVLAGALGMLGTLAPPASATAAKPADSSTAGPGVREIGPWEPSTKRNSKDGDPGGVSGMARLQRFNSASFSGIDAVQIDFTAAGERLKVRSYAPFNVHWYLFKNGALRNSGTTKAGETTYKNFNIREGERIRIKACPYWAGGHKCVSNPSLIS